MADTVNEQWLYPPNWDGNAPVKGGWKRVKKRFTCISDGTGETAVTKIDISELRTTLGNAPTRTVVESVYFNQQGFTSILLEWDRAPYSTICVLSGTEGLLDFTKAGGLADPSAEGDRTGDILLTTAGADAGDAYDITICLKLKDN